MRIIYWSSDVCSSDLNYKNQQIQEIVGSIGFLRALDGRVWGLELEATAQPTPDLRVSISFGALDSKYKQNAKSIISGQQVGGNEWPFSPATTFNVNTERSEEHTSELQSLMRISYAVFCLKKKKKKKKLNNTKSVPNVQ